MRKNWVVLGISRGAVCSLGNSGYQAAGKSLIHSTMSTWSPHTELSVSSPFLDTGQGELVCPRDCSDSLGAAQLVRGKVPRGSHHPVSLCSIHKDISQQFRDQSFGCLELCKDTINARRCTNRGAIGCF